ncbi:MAG: tetratricopeptide repeat protein [Gammaproteobacteria bacterium]|jgi:tetratricopeptide (TPR) repeat protein|nr:tetratricopeptide repeat protein [Gammaproteobacteria bacterium]
MQTDGELIRQARRLFEGGDFAGAERAYRELSEQLPETQRSGALLIVGACQQAQGRHDQAIETIERAVEMDDSSAESWYQLGRARRQAGDENGAFEALEQAITIDPNHASARVERGRQALAKSDGESAESHFRSALRADPDCVPALVAMAERMVEGGQLDRAQEMAARAVQLQPANVSGQLVMAQVFRHRGHPDFAERCLDNALATVPGSAQLHAARARLLLERGRVEEALAAAVEARRHGGGVAGLALVEAQAFRQLGRSAEARRRLEALAGERELDAASLMLLAELQLETGDTAAARETIGQLELASPSAATLMRAQLSEAEGDREGAAGLAAGLHDDPDPQVRQHARLMSGRLSLEGGDPEACVAALEPIASGVESEPLVHWMLARSLDQLGRHERAEGHIHWAGWRSSGLVTAHQRDLPESLYHELESLDTGGWDVQLPEDGRPRPVFLLGWPGSGRDQILAALAEHGNLPVLSRENASRRREALDLPARPEKLAPLDEDQIRLTRRRYLRGGGVDGGQVFESMWLPFAALPAIARYFPGCTVIVLDADARDLELDWRLSGLRGVDTLRTMWERERAALERFKAILPLDFLVVSRADIERDAGAVAARLAERLDAIEGPVLAAAIERHIQSLRPVGHWKHYPGLFDR